MFRVLVRIAVVAAFALGAVLLERVVSDPGQEKIEARAEPATMVRVARMDLVVGSFLDATEAPFAEWTGALSEDLVVQGVPSERDVMGGVVIAPIAAGQPISRNKLLLPGQDGFLAAVLHPGMRAVSVAVDPVSGNAGHIFPGDRVDLILTQSLDKEDAHERLAQRWASETILENVRVIAVDQSLSSDLAARDPGRPAHTMTLEVTQHEAEKVALAADLGRLSLSLRSLAVIGPDIETGPSSSDASMPAGAHNPTWASDVSQVIRALSGGQKAPQQAKAAAPTIRIFRGKTSEDLSP